MAFVVIIGCGVIGVATGNRLVEAGHEVLGLRRHPDAQAGAHFPIMAGDGADPLWYRALDEHPDAVLLCANPGLRRGKDNGLRRIASSIVDALPESRLVYTASTAVYADQQGGPADEQAVLQAGDAASLGLIAIEEAVQDHQHSLVLRVTALVGPTRTHVQQRLTPGEVVVKGSSERPFSYLHEDDCADICVDAVLGQLGTGMLNAAAPEQFTVASYYQRIAQRVGIAITVRGDDTVVPSRWIDARRLHAHYPGRVWKQP